MKLADYLISVLYGQYQDENDYGDFEGDFAEYLESKGFDDLKRYHLDDNDEMNERLETIQKMFEKRKENEKSTSKSALMKRTQCLLRLLLRCFTCLARLQNLLKMILPLIMTA